MRVCIHQPNFLPWLGFFNKILRSDVYVVFDDVQFPRGKDFAYRNKIKQPTGGTWITLPVANKSDLVLWNKAIISDNNWKERHLNQITNAYRQSKYYADVMPIISKCYLHHTNSVLEFNLNFITTILSIYNWRGRVIKSSNLPTDCCGMDKILHILKQLNATEYITGEGSGSQRYIDESVFKDNSITLTYQNFIHPTYSQKFGVFLPYMSIVDLLFNEGLETRDFVL